MVEPTALPLRILIDDVDVSSSVPFQSLSFEDYARRVSYFRFTSENPTGVTPARSQTVVISSTIDGTNIFDGYIVGLETKKRDNGIKTEYVIEAADKKIRLERSVLDYAELSGSDASILSTLLTNTYPDISDLFDFSSGVDSFISDMAMTTNNQTLLDALNNLSDLAGGANWRFDTASGGSDTVTFDAGGYSSYALNEYDPAVFGGLTLSDTATGNPGNAASVTRSPQILAAQGFSVKITLPSSDTVTELTFDVFITFTGNFDIGIDILDSSGSTLHTQTFDQGDFTTDVWKSIVATVDFVDDPFSSFTDTAYSIQIRKTSGTDTPEFRLDNLKFTLVSGGTSDLNWAAAPDAADFNFDIQTGDEFAFDIDTFDGDFDDFNSVTVVGGKEDVSVVWTYESDGDLDHFALETWIKNIVVEKNTNTDASPTWTVQADGVFGTDLLTSQGGIKDVLYDPEEHWLWFNSTPANLSKSIRVSGEIERPLRVRVEELTDGEPTYATSVFDDSITTQQEAVQKAQSLLDKRNAIRRITFKTYEPGLKPGQSIDIDDSGRGLNETLVITNIKTKWLGASGNALFTVVCGEDDLPSADIMIANNDKRSRQNALGAATTTSTINFLLDADGSTRLFDADGNTLFESS
jgi:hypothetical protein